jgi:hypothetical protein
MHDHDIITVVNGNISIGHFLTLCF